MRLPCRSIFAVALLGFIGSVSVSDTPDAASAEKITNRLAQEVVLKVLPEVEKLRGLEFKSEVPASVVDDQQARKQFERRIEKFSFEEQLDHLQQTYEVLGLIPPKTDLFELFLGFLDEQAGGFYDPEKKAYYLLEDAAPAMVSVFTAHEMTHALEDQYFDLDLRLRGALDNDDLMFAIGSVHEGSATALMSVYMVQALLRGELSLAEIQAVSEAELEKADKLASVPPILLRQLIGPYVLGANFLTRGNMLSLAGGYPREDVDQAYREGPRSSEQILHPEKYWNREQRDEPVLVAMGNSGKSLGRRFKLRASGIFGEIGLGPLAGAGTPLDLGSLQQLNADAWTRDSVAGWGGDRWELWTAGELRVVLLLTAWDTERDAEEFELALVESSAPGEWLRVGDRVALVAGDPGKRAGRVLQRMIRAEQR